MSKIIIRSENNNLCFADYFNIKKYTVPTKQVTWGLGRWNDLYGGVLLYENVQSGRWVSKFRIYIYIAFIFLEGEFCIFLRNFGTFLFAQTIAVSLFSGVCEGNWGNYETPEIKYVISPLMFEFRTYQCNVLAVNFEITVGTSELSDSSVFISVLLPVLDYWCRIHLWFRLMGGLHAKSMTSQRNRATHKMADMFYYGNVMTTTRWRICVTMETLWQQKLTNKFSLRLYCWGCTIHL